MTMPARDSPSPRRRRSITQGRVDPGTTDRRDRGQTTIDYAIGAALFLLAVGFVITFVPSMLDPFDAGQAKPLVADRAASQLAEDTLGRPADPARLNDTAVVEFFDTSDTVPVADELGIDDQYEINVTIERNVTGDADPDVLCYDGTDIHHSTGCGSKLARGPSVPAEYDTVVTARRTVYIDSWDVMLEVRVW
ncbi:MAG: hypothetical protein ABEJ48_02200 [Halobacteriales archaeon]